MEETGASVKKIYIDLLERYPKLKSCKKEIWKVYEAWTECFNKKGKLLICGNGGSEADSQHIVGELMKGFCVERPLSNEFVNKMRLLFPKDKQLEKLQSPLTAMALGNDQVLMSAYSNDISFQMIYAQEVLGYGRENDILVALSTSGNSSNVINAIKVAKIMGILTVGICGMGINKGKNNMMDQLCDICIKIPEEETYLVQELTLPVYHALCRMIETYYWGGNRRNGT